jgi:hypothetical protein
MLVNETYPDYFTATILEWKHLLRPEKYKDIVISSLEFLVKEDRIRLYAQMLIKDLRKQQKMREYFAS